MEDILSILAVFLILIVMITPKLIDLNQYNGLIVSEVQKAVGGKVKLGRISWGISHSIWLKVDGFSITGASAFPGDVKLTRIYANVSIHPLLARKVVLKKLLLESSEVRMRLEPGTAESQSFVKEPAATSQEKEAKTGGQDQPIAPPSTGAGAKPAGVHLNMKK